MMRMDRSGENSGRGGETVKGAERGGELEGLRGVKNKYENRRKSGGLDGVGCSK